MDLLQWQKIQDTVISILAEFGVKIIAAIAFWVIGRWLISKVVAAVQSSAQKQKVDATVMRYLGSVVTVTLNVLLVIGILGYFGIQTTTFAALLAAAGVAIGMAWSGLLANFAAGAFIIVLRPYKVGDFVMVAGITGTIKEIGLFTTSIDTPDNVLVVVGNNKVFADTIYNYSSNPYRRVELKCQLSGKADAVAAMQLLREQLQTIPNVVAQPAVEVEILEFNLVGPVLAVRPFCHTNHYWQVYFDSNKLMTKALTEAGFPAPMPAQQVLLQQVV